MDITLKYSRLELTVKEKNVLSWLQANSEYGCGTNLDNTSMVHWKQDEQWGMPFGGAPGDTHKFINRGYAPMVHSLAFRHVDAARNPALQTNGEAGAYDA